MSAEIVLRLRDHSYGLNHYADTDLLEEAAGAGEIERHAAHQQLVEDHPERVDVGARVDVGVRRSGLLRRHVLRRADDLPRFGEQRRLDELLPHCLGEAEVDDFGRKPTFQYRHQHVALIAKQETSVIVKVHHQSQPCNEGKHSHDREHFNKSKSAGRVTMANRKLIRHG